MRGWNCGLFCPDAKVITSGTCAYLQRPARGGAGRPRPLKVEAAQVAGNVYDFADKKQAWDLAALHGFGGELVGVDSAGGDFGFRVAFGSCGRDRPGVRLIFQVGKRLIGPRSRSVEIDPAVSEALRKDASELGSEGVQGSWRLGIAKGGGEFASGRKIDQDGLGPFPIRRNLENYWAAQPTMRNQHLLAKSLAAVRSSRRGNHFH